MSASVLEIESRHNPKFKQWRAFVDHPEKDECPWIPVEGWKQVQDVARNQPLEILLFSADRDPRTRELLGKARQAVQLSNSLFRLLSAVGSPQGVLAFFPKPRWSWQELKPALVFADRIQDPANLGLLLRTAAATGLFSLVTGPETVSCFNNKVIRASAGFMFSVPFLQGRTLQQLADRGYSLWIASASEGRAHFDAPFRLPLAFVVGNEGAGSLADSTPADRVHIPMSPGIDSLNAAVSGALLMYEVFRRFEYGQRSIQ